MFAYCLIGCVEVLFELELGVRRIYLMWLRRRKEYKIVFYKSLFVVFGKCVWFFLVLLLIVGLILIWNLNH